MQWSACLCFVFCCSTLFATEPPPQAPPTDPRFDEINLQLADHESRLKALEEKCDCEKTGVCLCKDGECQCPNCPKHSPKDATAWRGEPNANGRYVALFTSKDCGPCQPLKENCLKLGLDANIKLTVYENLEEAAAAGRDTLPACAVYQDGERVMGYAGSLCNLDLIQDWLSGKKKAESKPSSSFQSYSQPVYSSTPYYGGNCSNGNCYTPQRSYSGGGRYVRQCGAGGCRSVWVPY